MDDWERDKFEDGSTIQVGEQQLEKMKEFVDRHAQELHKIEEALDESMSVGWDLNFDPIALDLTPFEQTNMLELVKTKSKPLSKVTTVFACLCQEVEVLVEEAEKTYLPPLALFGELHTENPLEGDAQIQIGKMFPFFVDLMHFIERIYEVLKNLVRQLCSLYHPKQKGFETISLGACWRYLGTLFQVLITFDEVLKANDCIGTSWGKYKRMITQIKKETDPYGVNGDQIFLFEKLLLKIKGFLMDNLIFQNAINQQFEEPSTGRFQIRNNLVFREKFLEVLRNSVNDLRSEAAKVDPTLGKKYMRACTLFSFFCTLYPEKPELKMIAALWEVYKYVPMVHLFGTATWDPLLFFKSSIPKVVAAAKLPDISKSKREYLTLVVRGFPAKVAEYHMRISQWMIQMESDPGNLKVQSSVLTKGVFYAQGLSELLRRYLFLHFSLEQQILTSQFTLIFKCYELLKAIRMMYHRRSALIGESISKMIKKMAFQIQQQLMPLHDLLSDTRNKPSYAQLDALAAVTLAIQMMNGPATTARSIVFQLAFRQIPANLFKKGQEDIIGSRLSHWDVLSNLDKQVAQTCDCSLLYWTKGLIPSYIKFIFNNPSSASKLTFLFASLNDIIPLMKKAIHVPYQDLLNELKKEIESIMKKELVLPLSMEIHEDLALHIHHGTINKEVDRQWKESGPFLVRDLVPFLLVRPLYFWDQCISIKDDVQHFLNRTFYDLNTVALYNWQAFGEMRSLAFSKYGLELHQVHLPGHTLEQGLDILEIMRNIERFVSDYRYNLNNQIFIERTSENNYLSVINVQHIANSIRTHGTGIMSTAVSVTYQFLKEKIHLFSQFLFDELIKSRLYRDGITLSDARKETTNTALWRYPYETAKKFDQYVRGIGLTKDKKTYLQKFLELVTEIGNALGYVRMIRSGGMLHTSNAIQFVPDLNNLYKFEELVVADNLAADSASAAKNLDSVVSVLNKNFSEGADYFKMLVNVFANEYRSPDNAHLKNFYLIIPALTLAFVESIGTNKERYNKKGREEGGFTDDGFAIGIAYLLKLLDQNREFDSLNWFKSTVKYYKEELQAKGREKENVKISQLTRSKLSGELQEFQLLRWSCSSARIFFHD